MSIDLTSDVLARMWPSAPRDLREAVVVQWPAVCARRGITTRRRAISFLGNISHESDGGTIRRESMRYSAKRIMEIFGEGRHSANVGWAEAQRLAADAKKTGGVALAERVYGLGNPRMARDLGNTEPGDGWAFRGGGGSQTTGRAAYALAEQRSGLPLLTQPDLIADPEHWLDIAAADFGDCRRNGKTCLEWADAGNDEMVCLALNGGRNGLASRREWTARWDRALPPDGSSTAADVQTLQYGDRGWQVEALQRRLGALGYPVGRVDGAFGDATRAAVLDFQAREGLATDGSVGPVTRARLDAAAPREVSAARAAATVADVADHPAVAAAASTASLAKRSGVLAAVAAGVDGLKDDPITAVQAGVDKVQAAKGLMGQVSELAGGVVGWVAAHPVAFLSIVVAAVCALAVLRANGAVAAVVERYRAGHDMG